MKKLIILLCLSSAYAFAQQESFEKNNFIFTGGIGVGVGLSHQNYSIYSNYPDEDKYDIAIGFLIPVTAEFAISNKFGIGATFSRNTYVNTSSSKINTTNFGGFGAFHFVSKARLEMYTRLNAGYSTTGSFDEKNSYDYYTTNVNNNNTYLYKMNGWFVKPSFGLRHYYTETFGMFTDVAIGLYSLTANTVSINNTSYVKTGRSFNVTMGGIEISAGLAVKF